MKLYKYMSEEGLIRFAKTFSIRFSPPLSFNDPFEARPIFSDARDLIEKTKKGNTRRHYTFMTETLYHALSHGVLCRIGLFCLSESPLNILMWAHYAQEHKGGVVEFDADHPFFASEEIDGGPQWLRKVTYSRRRFPIEVGADTRLGYIEDIWFDRREIFLDAYPLLYHKAKDWAYERESRLARRIFPFGSRPPPWWNNNLYSGKQNWGDVVLEQIVPIPSKAVTAIIFGASSRRDVPQDGIDGLERIIDKVLRQKCDVDHIEMLKMRYSDVDFSLRLFDLRSANELQENVDPVEYANRMGGHMGVTPSKT